MKNDLIDFQAIGDERGYLVSFEAKRNIPFDIKRVYYIYGMNDKPRGFHAHKKLQQFLVCVSGSCKVLLDNGQDKKEYVLNQRNQGLIVKEMIWHEMYEFSEDCVLMVLASDFYDESDYIRQYEVFKSLIERETLEFREYDRATLECSYSWLNDPEIKFLTMTPDFTKESQENWFVSLKNINNYYIKSIYLDNEPIGALGIKNINENCGEYWGYIAEKKFWGKGYGKYLLDYAIRYAMNINLTYLYLRVVKDNIRAIKLYEKIGFVHQFEKDNVCYMIYKL
ncbi:GNAT family N-acetyltransferase [Lysinibacillus parviboronicapiens]|uniref:RimJ/RimL family protein N-acetyltransferase n=1 Tax=Lysinibacillus parviboronicapiens TaxID=436516 RepID=A0ABV2PI47_9BACI|nr:GNAT family N-acetyltransferase [Lysinibacillus parviboronicapiens]